MGSCETISKVHSWLIRTSIAVFSLMSFIFLLSVGVNNTTSFFTFAHFMKFSMIQSSFFVKEFYYLLSLSVSVLLYPFSFILISAKLSLYNVNFSSSSLSDNSILNTKYYNNFWTQLYV